MLQNTVDNFLFSDTELGAVKETLVPGISFLALVGDTVRQERGASCGPTAGSLLASSPSDSEAGVTHLKSRSSRSP